MHLGYGAQDCGMLSLDGLGVMYCHLNDHGASSGVYDQKKAVLVTVKAKMARSERLRSSDEQIAELSSCELITSRLPQWRRMFSLSA